MSAEVVQVRMAGFGGQGVVLAGILLGMGAVEDGLYAIQNQSYGAEARGGAARSEVLVSRRPILYPELIHPDVLVALSRPALDRYLPELRKDGTLIIDKNGQRKTIDLTDELMAEWMPKYLGENQLNVLKTLKNHFDPNNIINPGTQVNLSD